MNEPAPIGCDDALRLLAEYLARELDADAHAGVVEHLERCLSCYSRSEFERRLKTQLGTLGTADVPPSLDRRIRLLLR